ncbi:MAG: CooT family nickel-binding protein [Desulfobacteraceae bacterium]|jgi:predicted RNA-binding protein|nr:CooT family nickel-binding protein [Desulfobacteraceae bacterium]
MCEANAYLRTGEEERLVMEAVNIVEPDGESLRLENIFGEQKFLKARIHAIALNDKRVILVEQT